MPKIGEIKKGYELAFQDKYRKYIWHTCEVCGRQKWIQLRKGKPVHSRCQSCAAKLSFREHPERKRVGEDNHRWKAKLLKKGYTLVHLAPTSLFYAMAEQDGSIMEHRLIMAQYLGRCLCSLEIVHHIDGNKQNNEIGNLALVAKKTHGLAYSNAFKDGYEEGYNDCLKGRVRKFEEKTHRGIELGL